MAGTHVGAPQILATSLILTRVGIALVLPRASGFCVDLLHTPLLLLEVLLSDFHFIDNNVLEAAGEGGHVVGQNFLRRKKQDRF